MRATIRGLKLVLPDTPIPWRDLVLGAFVTAVLFTVGKSLINLFRRAAPSSPYARPAR